MAYARCEDEACKNHETCKHFKCNGALVNFKAICEDPIYKWYLPMKLDNPIVPTESKGETNNESNNESNEQEVPNNE